jgi:hypothetical protein
MKIARSAVGTKIVMLLVIALPATAFAHHSYAIYDNSKVMPIRGIIKKVDWVNPHAWVHITVSDPQGTSAEWSLECRSISELSRQGLRSIDLRTGDAFSALVWLARDGKKLATVVRATTASGKVFGLTREAAAGGGPPAGFRPPGGAPPGSN